MAKYPKVAAEVGIDRCDINTLLTGQKLREKLRKRINDEVFKGRFKASEENKKFLQTNPN